MQRPEIELFLKNLCEAIARAVDQYCESSDEKTDQMPEYVMSVAAAKHLEACGRSAILEATFATIARRLGLSLSPNEAAFTTLQEKIGLGKIDLTLLSEGDVASTRTPIGFLEMKKWKYYDPDVVRLTNLLSHISGAHFELALFYETQPSIIAGTTTKSVT